MSDITKEGEDRVKRWKSAQLRIKDIKSQLNSAECELSNAAKSLKNWLVPMDYKEGEKFAVAYEREFIQIEILPYNNCLITVRPRSK